MNNKNEQPAPSAGNWKPGSKMALTGDCNDCGLNYCHCAAEPREEQPAPVPGSEGVRKLAHNILRRTMEECGVSIHEDSVDHIVDDLVKALAAAPPAPASDEAYFPSDLKGPALLGWISGFYGPRLPYGLPIKLIELSEEWDEQIAPASDRPDRETVAKALYEAVPVRTASSNRLLSWAEIKELTGFPYPQIVEGHYKEADVVLPLIPAR